MEGPLTKEETSSFKPAGTVTDTVSGVLGDVQCSSEGISFHEEIECRHLGRIPRAITAGIRFFRPRRHHATVHRL
jgi:hypothetical protein